ncbi:MAG: cyclic nucleotide-binding domain-containing protein [Candidatus Lambdaproteobacteria bacterium]|nr:cyclic nucleotide-binding domain-containing protein [Candidatus Lambdaproteobacteria bacterium]
MTEANSLPQAARAARRQDGLRVLVVDPQPESRALVKAALRSMPLVDAVFETSSPQNVVSIHNQDPVDVVMIDQNLPAGLDVFQAVNDIRRQAAAAQLRFVLMANNLDLESRRKSVECGILGHLPKPFDLRGLETALRDAVGKVSTNHRDTLNKVRRIPFFSEFSDLELVRLLKLCHTRKFQAGEHIFHEGDHGDRLYVVLTGQIELVKARESGPEVLALMNTGDVFGEMSIVDAQPRSADGRAKNDCMLIELNAGVVNDPNDILALKLFRQIAFLVTKKLRAYTAN